MGLGLIGGVWCFLEKQTDHTLSPPSVIIMTSGVGVGSAGPDKETGSSWVGMR